MCELTDLLLTFGVIYLGSWIASRFQFPGRNKYRKGTAADFAYAHELTKNRMTDK